MGIDHLGGAGHVDHAMVALLVGGLAEDDPLPLDLVVADLPQAFETDRVHRFLANAGLVKPLSKNNPEKAKPKKMAQERAAANAKAAEAAAAAPAEG